MKTLLERLDEIANQNLTASEMDEMLVALIEDFEANAPAIIRDWLIPEAAHDGPSGTP